MKSANFLNTIKIILLFAVSLGAQLIEDENSIFPNEINHTQATSAEVHSPYTDPNKEFWESMYQNSILNTKRRYNVLNGDRICFTCPIDRNTFTQLYNDARKSSKLNSNQAPPPITIVWAAELTQKRLIFFCRNNTKISQRPIYLTNEISSEGHSSPLDHSSAAELEYSCEHNRLCLNDVKNSYPDTYQCSIKSFVSNVKMNVIGKHLVNYFLNCVYPLEPLLDQLDIYQLFISNQHAFFTEMIFDKTNLLISLFFKYS
jgi:hypothetical protein